MKGDPEVIRMLNEALKLELGAVNQYWLHYRLLDDWGFTKLAKKERAESIDFLETQLDLLRKIGKENYGMLNADSANDVEGH